MAAVRSPFPPAQVLPLSALREATSRDRLSGPDPVDPPSQDRSTIERLEPRQTHSTLQFESQDSMFQSDSRELELYDEHGTVVERKEF